MKRDKKIKTIGLLSLACALVLPMVTLTSCSGITQYYLPVLIGGKDNGPFRNFTSSKDENGFEINDYIPDTYDYFLSPKSSTQTTSMAYGYVTPRSHELNDDEEQLPKLPSVPNPAQETIDNWKGRLYESQWMDTTDQRLSNVSFTNDTKNDDGKKTESISYFDARNYNINRAVTSVNTISNAISTFFDYMLYYQLHGVNQYMSNIESNKSLLDSIYGGLINLDVPQKQTQYLEYFMDLSNLIATNDCKIKFSQSGLNFNLMNSLFKDSTHSYNSMSYLTCNGDGSQVATTTYDDGKAQPTTYDDGTEMLQMKDDNTPSNPYAITTNIDKDDDSKGKYVSGFNAIPFIFNVDDLNFDFYNSDMSNSDFLPNDWIINDKDSVDSAVAKAQGWNKFWDITHKQDQKQLTKLNWKVSIQNNNKSLSWSQYLDNEPSLKLNKDKLSDSSFICLATYNVANISDTTYDSNEKITKIEQTRFPVFNEITKIYPAWFLKDDSAFKKANPDDPDSGNTIYFLDQTYLDKKMNSLVEYLTQHKQINPDSDGFKEFNCIPYYFSNYNQSNWIADPANFLK